MKQWIINRWNEPKTKIGLGVVGYAIVKAFFPEYTWLAEAILGAGGMGGIVGRSPSSPDHVSKRP